jgi:hypothetical protein
MKTEKLSQNPRILLVNYLVKNYPHLWQSTEPSVIKNVGMVDMNLLIEKIYEGITCLGIESSSRIIVHAPVSSFSERFDEGVVGHKSQKHNTIEVELNGKRYFIKYSSGSSLNGLSTLTKESLVIYFANSKIEYQNFKITCNPNFISMYHNLLQRLIKDITKERIFGVPDCDVEDLLIELKNELMNDLIDPNRNVVKTIFNAMAGGNYLAKNLPRGYSLRRDKYFDEIREFIGYLNNSKRVDNFCPMDIVAIKNGFETKLTYILSLIKENPYIANQKETFNALCASSEDIKHSEKPIWCISLKQEVAAGGKGKSAIGKGGNLLKDHQTLPANLQIKLIEAIRTKLSLMKNKGFTFNVLGDMDKLESKNTIINKLSAITLLNHIMCSDAFYTHKLEQIVSMCAGLGKNPPFTKMILNEKGDHSKVECLDYSENYIIKLSKYHPIDIVDKNSSNSIDINFFVEDTDSKTGKPKTSKVKIELRTNGLSVQSTVELKYL